MVIEMVSAINWTNGTCKAHRMQARGSPQLVVDRDGHELLVLAQQAFQALEVDRSSRQIDSPQTGFSGWSGFFVVVRINRFSSGELALRAAAGHRSGQVSDSLGHVDLRLNQRQLFWKETHFTEMIFLIEWHSMNIHRMRNWLSTHSPKTIHHFLHHSSKHWIGLTFQILRLTSKHQI